MPAFYIFNCGWATDVTWTILTMYLLPFWALNVSVALLYMQGQKAPGFHQKCLNLCSKDERSSYRFGTIWGWVSNDRIFIIGWTIFLNNLVYLWPLPNPKSSLEFTLNCPSEFTVWISSLFLSASVFSPSPNFIFNWVWRFKKDLVSRCELEQLAQGDCQQTMECISQLSFRPDELINVRGSSLRK